MHDDDSAAGRSPEPPAPPGRLLIYLAVAAVSAAAGVGATVAVQHATGTGPQAAGLSRDAAAHRVTAPDAMNDEAVYGKVEPGVVDVTASLRYLQETAKGTGFVIDAAAGLVLTNNHVINGATSVTVTPVTSGRSYPARVLGYDRAHDVALLQLPGAAGLRAVSIGRSAQVQEGTQVLALGNEGGQGGSPTVAPGVISGLGRTIVASDQSSGLTETLHGMMQTSADIRPGDSGGPLADAAGRVIGISTAAGGNTVYSGYAIPINQVLPIARQIAARRPGGQVQIGLPGLPRRAHAGQHRRRGPRRHERLHRRRHHGAPGERRPGLVRRAGRRGALRDAGRRGRPVRRRRHHRARRTVRYLAPLAERPDQPLPPGEPDRAGLGLPGRPAAHRSGQAERGPGRLTAGRGTAPGPLLPG